MEVVAGSYTSVPIPLTPAYIITGIVTDSEGNHIGGATVTATSVDTNQTISSVTNGAGVYYL